MARPVTLFTGQWADLPFEEVCKKAKAWGYDGLEIACWATTWTSARPRPTTPMSATGSASSTSTA